MTKRKFYYKHRDTIISYLLIGLPILWWCIFFLFAFCRAIYFSFTDLRFDPALITRFNFDNFIQLFTDKTFGRAFANTGIWTLIMTVANNLFGLLVAYLVFNLAKGKKFVLALLFWPTLVSAVAGAEITKLIFNPSEQGVMNTIIIHFGGKPLGWYNDPKIALITLMISPFLLGFSMQMMLFYVALEGVPENYIEAMKLETDSKFAMLRYIYVPLIKNVITLNVLLSIINNIKILGPMQLVSDSGMGGPLDSTMSIMLYLYNKGITGFEMGYACAIGVVTLIIILILSVIQNKISGEKAVDYE